ncbi:MAG: Asp-tRNA(Asn)/Glu-tRNA(Gln) amidotransferase subunit GatA [Planctomycetota bacterium]
MSTTAITSCTATRLASDIRAGELRAGDVTDAFLARIATIDDRVGAFLEVFEDSARKEAEAVDAARKRGDALGPLCGVPVAIKDAFARRGNVMTCASRILQGFVSPYTATAVARLEAAGAVILGRTNMDEFAMGSSTEHSAVKKTHNPFDLARIPGGSSGGSAAAVSARMAPLALGSDTGGSVRQPAALCGISGLKPTYGRISRFGLVAYASSLDHVATFAHDISDLASVLAVLAGMDANDSTSLDATVPDYQQSLGGDLAGIKVGVPEECFAEGLDPQIESLTRDALGQLEELGCELVPVNLPHTRYAIPAYYLIATAEASSNLARYDGVRYGQRLSGDHDLETMYRDTRAAGFGDEVKLRILLGSFCLQRGYYDAYYLKATKVRTLIRDDFESAFRGCDVLATPTSPIPAFLAGEKLEDPLAMYLCDVLTVPANLAGIPGISIPCGFTAAGLPAGLQILGPVLGEEQLLKVAAAYQDATDHHQREPVL